MDKIGLDGSEEFLYGLIGEERPIPSWNIDFNIGGIKYSGIIVDSSQINPVIDKLRPLFRAFLGLSILVFNVKQFHSVMGLDSDNDNNE